MEYIFENQFMCTKNFYKEFYIKSFFKNTFLVIFNIILIVNFFIHLSNIIFPTVVVNTDISSFSYIIFDLLVLCFELYLYISRINNAYNRNLELNKELKVNWLVNEDSIYNLENNISIEIEKIVKVLKTKSYYILISKANNAFIFKKDSFTKGTLKEFEEFLKRKKIMK